MKARPFSVRTAENHQICGLVDLPDHAEPEAVVVIVPGFGHTQLDYSVPAMYLAGNGLGVVRFDAVNHAGSSQGDIFDFTLSELLANLETVTRFARRDLAAKRVGVFASSLGGRVAIRALSGPCRPEALASISTVISVQDTLRRVAGEDVVGVCLADPGIESYEILDERVGRGFLMDIVNQGWADSLGTSKDLAAAKRLPALWVQGREDPWVDVTTAIDSLSAQELGSVLVLEDAVHTLNFASAKIAMEHVVRFFRGSLLDRETETVRGYRFQDLVAKVKGDRAELKGLVQTS